MSAAPPHRHPVDLSAATIERSRDLPLDAHVHTDQSPDSDVPIDVYAALALERGIAELAITDHVDFDPRDPAYDYTSYADRERVVREAAERWAPRGVAIRFGAELTFNRRWADDVRAHLRRHSYDFTIGSVHDWPGSPYRHDRVASFIAGRDIAEVVGPYYTEVVAAARSGLFDTIGHLDVVKRYLNPYVTPADLGARPEVVEPVLQALVDAGVALELNTSGLRQAVRETYPSPATVTRFRELGGSRVTVGSDAHRRDWLGWRLADAYDALRSAGFESVVFRRGGEPVRIEIPAGSGATAAP
ncbi:MAG: histidinol-phosphatase HisJ family protein [Chloroflexota bacterium]